MITYQMVLFFHFTYVFVHDEFDNPYSSIDTGNRREKSHLCLSNPYWKVETRPNYEQQKDKMPFPGFAILQSSALL